MTDQPPAALQPQPAPAPAPAPAADAAESAANLSTFGSALEALGPADLAAAAAPAPGPLAALETAVAPYAGEALIAIATKHPLASNTIRGLIVAAVGSELPPLAQQFHVIPPTDADLSGFAGVVVSLIGLAWALVGRLTASRPIGTGSAQIPPAR